MPNDYEVELTGAVKPKVDDSAAGRFGGWQGDEQLCDGGSLRKALVVVIKVGGYGVNGPRVMGVMVVGGGDGRWWWCVRGGGGVVMVSFASHIEHEFRSFNRST